MSLRDLADAGPSPAAPLLRSAPQAWQGWRGTALDVAPIVLAAGFLAERAISGVLTKVGHAGAALDDAYIHFQYARAIAEGHPMRFQAGEPMTSGATSLLWPAVLAPFWLLGARGDAILWAAWGLSFAALAGLAWEAARLTDRLAGRAAAAGAAAMTVAFGGFVWSAASGMEVVPFAWVVARASRRASEWAEAQPADRTPQHAGELVFLAWAAALMRPEGALTTLFVAGTLAIFARHGWSPASKGGVGARGRWPALAALAAAAAPPLLLALLTGSMRSSTAVAKLLPGNPYYEGGALSAAVLANVKVLVGTLLGGEVWSAEFLPSGGAPVAFAGLLSVVWLGAKGSCRWRAAAVLLLAATLFAPCFYLTFLWNRLRYLWPFATGWLVGLACLARVVGDWAAALRPRWRLATPILCGAFAGLFAAKLPWVLDDVAQSASGIDRQQVSLGRWAKANLPREARIGVNDTGAIAYFGERKTFDVVGLTTQSEARYWVAGAGSRFEHYERLGQSARGALPTHFIVYPEWMALDAVLGQPLFEATVLDSTILGGRTMRAYEADWSLLGSGERPWTRVAGDIVDAVDVADLESEHEHAYELLGAREGDNVARRGVSPEGAAVVDGGRTNRGRDRFVAHLRPGAAARGIVRLASSGGPVAVRVNGSLLAALEPAEDGGWAERTFEIAPGLASANTDIELVDPDGQLATFHYWFVE